VTAWGDNTFGQTNVPPGLSNVVAIAAGSYHAVALRGDGSVVVWGDMTYGQNAIPAGLSGVTAIAAGASSQTFALKSDGTVVCWGLGSASQLDVPAGLSNVVSIAAGYQNAAAVRADGSIDIWGYNYYGQAFIPARVNGVANVALGGMRAWAQYHDGYVDNWGFGAPQSWSNVVLLGAGGTGSFSSDYGVALRSDGTMASAYFYTPFSQTLSSLKNVVSFAANQQHLLVVVGDGTPFLSQRLHDRSVIAGAPAIFTSGVVGAAPVFYQWQFNGNNLVGQTNNLLVITNTPLSAAGSYRCIVSNALGNITAPAANLAVLRSTPQLAPVGAGNGGGFALSLSGLSGHGEVVLYSSTNLTDWVAIQTNPPVLGTAQFMDFTATNSPMKFYRVEER